MKLLLIGHGRMGRLVEALAGEHGCSIAGVFTEESPPGALAHEFPDADVAIDFSLADAVTVNLQTLAARRLSVVIGTTGWQAQEAALRELAASAGIGVFASANFSIGMHIFSRAVAEAAAKFAAQPDVGAWIHEAHHAAKKDAPSGTALLLKSSMIGAGYTRPIDMTSTRAGFIPGTHEVGFDGAAETVTLSHRVRDRAVFAHGAIAAAKWLKGRRGWFGMRDMIGG
jgi:4-hydroxy-tetrahydrodipicolinate reductase